MAAHECQHCGSPMGKNRHPRAVYCTRACKNAAKRQRKDSRWSDDPPNTGELMAHKWTPIEAALLLRLPDALPYEIGKGEGYQDLSWIAKSKHPETKAAWKKHGARWMQERATDRAVLRAGQLLRRAGLLAYREDRRATVMLTVAGKEYRETDKSRLAALAGDVGERIVIAGAEPISVKALIEMMMAWSGASERTAYRHNAQFDEEDRIAKQDGR